MTQVPHDHDEVSIFWTSKQLTSIMPIFFTLRSIQRLKSIHTI